MVRVNGRKHTLAFLNMDLCTHSITSESCFRCFLVPTTNCSSTKAPRHGTMHANGCRYPFHEAPRFIVPGQLCRIHDKRPVVSYDIWTSFLVHFTAFYFQAGEIA